MNHYDFAGCLVVKEGKVLLVQEAHREAGELWSIPVGSLEPGETFEQAATRETTEETGYEVIITGPYWEKDLSNEEFKSTQQHNDGFIILHIFPATVHGGNLITGSDVLDAHWFSMEEVETLPLRGEWVRDIIRLAFP